MAAAADRPAVCRACRGLSSALGRRLVVDTGHGPNRAVGADKGRQRHSRFSTKNYLRIANIQTGASLLSRSPLADADHGDWRDRQAGGGPFSTVGISARY
jgi:hypothetical protein